MKIKLKLITLFLVFILPSIAYSQYYGTIKLPIKFKGTSFNMDSISFQPTQIIDNRADRSILGTGFYGVANHFVRYEVKFGIPIAFSRFFKKALKRTAQGNRTVMVEFKKLSMVEKQTNSGVKGGRRRQYEIDVNYYLIHEGTKIFILNDTKRQDSISTNSGYFIDEFCSDFFRQSLKALNKSFKDFNVTKELALQKKDSLAQVINTVKDTTDFKLKANGGFIFRNVELNPVIKKSIEDKYITNVKGKYKVEYTIDGSGNIQNEEPITTIKYQKSSISPYIYITIPAIIILGIISGANSG